MPERHVVESARRGGIKDGAIRAAKLAPERRAEIAKKVAKARWGQGALTNRSTAQNLRKLAKLIPMPQLAPAI